MSKAQAIALALAFAAMTLAECARDLGPCWFQ